MKLFIYLGAGFALTGIILGALSAHAFKELLLVHNNMDIFNRALDYLFYHAFALLVTALLIQRYPKYKFHIAGWLFLTGSCLFQGSLIIYSLTDIKILTSFTPFGGFVLMAGWIALGIQARHIKSSANN